WIVSTVVATMFALGAVILFRQSAAPAEDTGAGAMRAGPGQGRPYRAALSSFGVFFTAEWADASQLATATLAARFNQPLLVGVRAFEELRAIPALAVVAGRELRDRVRARLLLRCADFLFAGFAVVGLVRVWVWVPPAGPHGLVADGRSALTRLSAVSATSVPTR